ncbi:MAG: hypothetical protein AAF772_05220 [Acidobacteriota bacterium]
MDPISPIADQRPTETDGQASVNTLAEDVERPERPEPPDNVQPVDRPPDAMRPERIQGEIDELQRMMRLAAITDRGWTHQPARGVLERRFVFPTAAIARAYAHYVGAMGDALGRVLVVQTCDGFVRLRLPDQVVGYTASLAPDWALADAIDGHWQVGPHTITEAAIDALFGDEPPLQA